MNSYVVTKVGVGPKLGVVPLPLAAAFNRHCTRHLIRKLFAHYSLAITRYSLFAVFFLVSAATITTIFIRQNSRKPERATVHPSLAHH